jgi:hypothetical protein
MSLPGTTGLITLGTWKTSSIKDPRFNLTGQAYGGLYDLESTAKQAVKQKEKEFKCIMPDDLMFSCEKLTGDS